MKLGEEEINNIRLLIREIDRVGTVQNIPSVAQKIGISDKELNVLIHKVYDLFGDDIFKKAYDFGGNEFDLIKGNYYSDKDVDKTAKSLFFDEIRYLGEPQATYSFNKLFSEKKYSYFLNDFKDFLNLNGNKEVFTLLDLESNSRYFEQIETF
ncbi:MAG: hypothetical protein RQ875_13780, partial [Vicingaceae bacterium]|nr:hypothetical protein [Vicingaceae bacterium]